MSTKFVFTKPRKVAVLKRMRELLERRGGWIKREMENGRGGYCLLGAEQQALTELYKSPNGDHRGRKLSLQDAAKKRGFSGVINFNDCSKTRKKDVLALLDEKIAELS